MKDKPMVKYYEESKNSKGELVSCGENEYSKYDVEDALRTLERARSVLADPKMTKYVKLCMQNKRIQDAEIASQLNVETKVGKKLKEVFSG